MERARAWIAALAIPLAIGCGQSAATAPEVEEIAIEEIAEAEIEAAARIEGLTGRQREAVREILREARARLRALRRAVRDGRIARAEARRRARAIHERTIERLSEILTEDQLRELLQRLREHRRADLDLTEEQRAEIVSLRREFRERVVQIRALVRAGEITGREGRLRLRRAHRAFRAAVCGVLTAEQRSEVRFCGGAREG